jgi:D-alanine-D-alanine ligase
VYERPDVDFVISLLNRGGFSNSEMLGPLLLTKAQIPFLGASPIVRGLADDKHLMKVVARHVGVPTAPWVVSRRGNAAVEAPPFDCERFVVKPNASSASWGVETHESWNDALRHIEALHKQGHDVIVEPWIPLYDLAVPVVGSRGPWILPPLIYAPPDPERIRSYAEKRNLVEAREDPLLELANREISERAVRFTRALLGELWPFDYGRFEFRFDPATGSLSFMEVNLSCNLWSKKTISRSARTLGVAHAELVETILAHSMARQGLIEQPIELRA